MPLFSKNGTRANMLSDPFVHIIIVIVLGFAIYMSTAVAPFAFDDGTTVKKNPALKNMNYFTDRELLDRALENKEIDEHFRNRIIGHLTFALNYKLHGFEVAGYHVFSVLAHLSSSILVYLLMLLTAKTPWFRKVSGIEDDPVSYRITALFAALLFVSHPVQTQAVTYISQRFAALATMLCLLSLVLYIRARQLSRESESLRSKYCMLYAASLFSAILAMKTKEISFTLPVVIALYEAMFFEGNARERLAYLLPLLLTMLIVPVTVLQDRNVLSDIKHFEASFQGGSAENDIMRYLLTQFRVLVTYLRMLVLPLNQNLDYDYPMYHSFFQPPVFLSLLLNAGIFIGGAYLYRRSGREGIKDRQWLRVMAFGIFWFFITLSVESSIIPLADVIFEHRLYLPSAGFFMAVISAAAIGKRRFGKTGAQGVTLFLAFMVLAFSAATFQRNKIWGDGIKLWEDVVRKSPNKSRPHNNLGVAYQNSGNMDKAVNEYLAALKIAPDYAEAHNNLGLAYQTRGHTDAAINEYLNALKIKPDFADAYNGLGMAYADQGYIDNAITEFLAALKLNPDFAEAHYNLGNAYGKQGRTSEAINEYLAALKIRPDFPEARYNLGYQYANIGRISEAIAEFQKTVSLNPQDTKAREGLEILVEQIKK